MKMYFKSWRRYLTEKQEIDSSTVAKLVLINDKGEVLFLKRSNYVDKFAGDWDLPGGHVHVGENLKDGLFREVEEETGLEVRRASLVTKIDNLYFFKAIYEQGDIILSNEHTEHRFRDPFVIENPSKFEKVAQIAVKND